MAVVRVVEDGTGLANATTYTAVQYFNDYLEFNGFTCCDTDEQREAKLHNGTAYIELEYQGRIVGEKLNENQAFIFPRLLSDNSTLYPDALQKAVCSLAIKSSKQKGVLLRDSDKRVIKEKVDVIERQFDSYSKDEANYNDVEALLRPYLIVDSTNSYQHDIIR